MASYFTSFPDIYGKKHEVLIRLEPVQELICKANNGATHQKHPDKILSQSFFGFELTTMRSRGSFDFKTSGSLRGW
jgi:hypothetical protein